MSASYQKKVWVWSDAATAPTTAQQDQVSVANNWVELDTDSESMSRVIDLIETTNYNTQGDRRRKGGLRDWSVSVNLFYDDTAGSASVVIEDFADMRQEMWIRYAPKGTETGARAYVGRVLAGNFDLDGGPEGVEMASVEFSASEGGRRIITATT